MKDNELSQILSSLKKHHNSDMSLEPNTFWQKNLMSRIQATAKEEQELTAKEIAFGIRLSVCGFATSLILLICYYLSGIEEKIMVAQVEALLSLSNGIIF